MHSEFIQGFLLQASLIFAFGAQNIFVLESGLKKQKHLLVAVACTLCDFVLTMVGVLGAATIFVRMPMFKIFMGVIGVAFMLYYGLQKILAKPVDMYLPAHLPIETKKVITLTLGFSLLNPHVYLDTVVLIGSYSAKFQQLIDRAWFGLGASFASFIWFFSLVLLAATFSKFFINPKRMRTVSQISGIILICLAFKLAMQVYQWI
jgi:L-lysine exporter family protein LysE/ArgO